MKEYTERLETDCPVFLPAQVPAEDALFFDIETTGFAPGNTVVYLIGCVYHKENAFYITQWFADAANSEREILSAFIKFTGNFKTLIHYNGSGFDIPYIIKKCHIYGINCDFSHLSSLDIYKEIQPLKTMFKIENLKQKTVEKFMGVEREDCYTGGELIDIYHRYIKNPEDELLKLLLLHNHDDILGMTQIIPVLNYTSLLNGEYTFCGMELTESAGRAGKELIISLNLDKPLPARISNGNEYYYLTAFKDTLKICVKVHTDELKYFYSNYKDYYYLPEEDRALHKSVAFYVDKNYRTRAKAANCYSKKTGLFLPQTEELITPYFKIDYPDKITYFEYTDDFVSNKDAILEYVNLIIQSLV